MIRAVFHWLCERLSPGREALRRSEARYADLFDQVPDGVYETLPDGTLVAINPALVRMLGYESAEELKAARRAGELYVDPEQREQLRQRLEAKGALRNVEINLYRRDGTVITVLENARVVRDRNGRVVCFQGTLTDITDRKRAVDQIQQARDEALEASRLKTQFLANVSHELRTPLNGVLAMAQMLAESPLPKEQAECAGMIQNSAHFLAELINDILDFSCIEAGRLELETGIFRIRDIVEETAAMVAPRGAGKGLCIVTEIAPELPELVSGDGGRLRQVLSNLAVNAVKFTAAGDVVMTARRAAALEHGVLFSVRDTGIGIDPAAHQLIFEPFCQADGSTKRRFGGTGLGLAIARQIVERMGGTMQVQSRPGEGSTFQFTVPLPPAPGCRGSPAKPIQGLAGVPVLVAEPQTAARAVLVRWLERWGARVRVLDTPLSAGTGPAGRLAVVAEELLGPGRPSAPPAFLPAGVGVILMGPIRAEPALPEWVRGRLARPVRELALLEALLRAVADPRSPAVESSSLTRLGAALGRGLAPGEVRGRILAAEDNEVNQVVIERLVRRLGYAIDVVNSGQAAVAAVARGGYALVLMDCQMPGMDGFEATSAIRALPGPAGTLPIVAVTAHAAPGDRQQCLAAGMDDYLAKPILLDDLARILDRWLARPAPQGQPRGTA